MSKQLTVGELKKLLEGVPDDAWIVTEGCDCIGPSDDISYYTDDNTVVIERNDRIDRETHEEIDDE